MWAAFREFVSLFIMVGGIIAFGTASIFVEPFLQSHGIGVTDQGKFVVAVAYLCVSATIVWLVLMWWASVAYKRKPNQNQ